MTTDERLERLRLATVEAQHKAAAMQAEISSRVKGADSTMQVGDVVIFPSLADTAFDTPSDDAPLWVVVEAPADCADVSEASTSDRSQATGFWLLVAADLNPMLGSADVATPSDGPCGRLSVRCGIEVQLPSAALQQATCHLVLDPTTLETVQRRRASLRDGAVDASDAVDPSGTLDASDEALETDLDVTYLDALRDGPERARQSLLKHFADNDSESRIVLSQAIESSTGHPASPGLDLDDVLARVRDDRVDPGLLLHLQQIHRVATQPHLGASATWDPADLRQAHWGVVFAESASAELRQALEPLIVHRRSRLGADAIKVLEVAEGEDWRRWLSGYGVAPGRVAPHKVPFYLLLVGSPTEISYDFQLALGLDYAVGRLSFETVAEFRAYAEQLVAVERAHANAEMPLDGSVVFLYGAHSVGSLDNSSVAELPRRLLSQPGGTRAVVGWLASTGYPSGAGQGDAAVPQTLARVLRQRQGVRPLGDYLRGLIERLAEVSVQLEAQREAQSLGAQVDDEALAALWGERQMLRHWVVLGDPAVSVLPASATARETE